jgi:hypothetical protein
LAAAEQRSKAMAEVLEAGVVIDAMETHSAEASTGLRRTVGFYGLMFVSLGSIIRP